MNHKKGLFSIESKWNSGQITGDEEIDKSTLNVLSELKIEAMKDGMIWKKEWQDSQPKDNPNQTEIFEGDKKGDGELGMGFD